METCNWKNAGMRRMCTTHNRFESFGDGSLCVVGAIAERDDLAAKLVLAEERAQLLEAALRTFLEYVNKLQHSDYAVGYSVDEAIRRARIVLNDTEAAQ